MLTIIILLGIVLLSAGTIIISSTLFPKSILAYNVSCFSAIIFVVAGVIFIIYSTIILYPILINLPPTH